MALETIRQNIAVNNVISPVGSEVMAEKRGAYRGETVRSSGENSKISNASKQLGLKEALNTDLASLKQKTIKQGQGTHPKALARASEQLDKLPQMPQGAHLDNLVRLMEGIAELQTDAQIQPEDEQQDQNQKLDSDQADGTTSFAIGQQQQRSGGGVSSESGEGSGNSEQDQQKEGAETPAKPPFTKEQIFQALQQYDGDVTHQAAALGVMLEHFELTGASKEFQALLEDAALEFQMGDLGRDVRAGMAAAVVASQVSQTMETDPAAVRDTYRSMLREQPNLGKLFDDLAKLDPSKKFEKLVETFREIASKDLSSTGPSTDPGFLHTLLTELSKLKKLQTTYEMGKDMVAQTTRMLPPKDRGLTNANEVTSELLHFIAKPAASLSDARKLLGGMAKASPLAQVLHANGMRDIFGKVPDEVWPSPQSRTQQSTAIGSLLNLLVASENDAYASSQQSPKS